MICVSNTEYSDQQALQEDEMPVYEFECTKGHITEKLVPMGTKNTRCTKCKKRAKKILSTCTFELKGGGWYADGYSSTTSKGSKKSV
jgi:putative FmdB family regulatory protein